MGFGNWGIRARIATGLVVILFLAVLSAGNALYRNISVKFEAGEVSTSWIPAIENIGRMKGYVADHYLVVSDRMAGRDTTEVAAFSAQLQRLEADLAKATDIYAATLLTYTADNAAQGDAEKALYADYQAKRDAYVNVVRQGLAVINGGSGDPDKVLSARRQFGEQAPTAFRKAYDAMEAILKFNLEGTAGAADKVRSTVASTEVAMVVALGVILLAGGLLIWYVPASVTRPVHVAVTVAKDIAEGDLSRKVVVHGTDELGQLLGHLEVMRTQLANVVHKVRIGSDSVANASAEIAHGNHDLSSRTESQANQLAISASGIAVSGGEVVGQAGTTMDDVVASIRRVADIVGEISAASSEQSMGVAQVSEAVSHIDQVTQQNAALVEEMAAAASGLTSQANELVQVVSTFKLAAGQAV